MKKTLLVLSIWIPFLNCGDHDQNVTRSDTLLDPKNSDRRIIVSEAEIAAQPGGRFYVDIKLNNESPITPRLSFFIPEGVQMENSSDTTPDHRQNRYWFTVSPQHEQGIAYIAFIYDSPYVKEFEMRVIPIKIEQH